MVMEYMKGREKYWTKATFDTANLIRPTKAARPKKPIEAAAQ
jgi:hypothetical protein